MVNSTKLLGRQYNSIIVSNRATKRVWPYVHSTQMSDQIAQWVYPNKSSQPHSPDREQAPQLLRSLAAVSLCASSLKPACGGEEGEQIESVCVYRSGCMYPTLQGQRVGCVGWVLLC